MTLPNRTLYRFFLYTVGAGFLVGLFYFVRFMIAGISGQWGYGFFFGMMFAVVMFYLGTRAEESNRG